MQEKNPKLKFLDSYKESLNKDKLDHLSDLSHKLKILQEKPNQNQVESLMKTIEQKEDVAISTLEEVVKKLKEKERKLSQILIPSILEEVNLKEIKLKSGEKITVNDKVKASITKDNKTLAYTNMIKDEMNKGFSKEEATRNIDALFKTKLETEVNEELMTYCLEKNIPYDKSLNIAWQTLNKYCRDKLEAGESIPDGISHYEYKETKLK